MEVGAWVYKHMDGISGVSFLPRDTGSYRQAPYEEIDETKYNEMVKSQSLTIDWTKFKEETDTTTGSQQLACVAGVCEL
jgi:ribonucleoside-diphosphate reductase alpha chain